MQWEYAIDAGSETIRLATRTGAEIFAEPAWVAQRGGKGSFAWGERAKQICGREPEGVSVIKPVSGGLITDVNLMAKWVRRLTEGSDKRMLKRPGVLIGVSSVMRPDVRDEFERRVIDEGIPVVGLVNTDLACAIGASLPIMEPEACLIADIGAEKISASLISGGTVLRSEFLPYGMRRADERIMAALRAEFGYAIGPATAAEIRREIGAVKGVSDDVKTEKAVFDYSCMLPRRREIPAGLVNSAIDEVLRELPGMLMRMILFAPEEISADLLTRGVTLAGGGASLFGLDSMLKEALSLPVAVAPDPENCVINGLQTILSSQKAYSHLIEDEMEEALHP